MVRPHPAGDGDRGVGDSRRRRRSRGRLIVAWTRLELSGLGPAYEEVLQHIFAVRGGEWLFANLAMHRQIAGGRFRLRAHDLIARLAPGADEIDGIVFNHITLRDWHTYPLWLRFSLKRKQHEGKPRGKI